MEKYISKQVSINKPDHFIYGVLSDFNNLAPMLGDKLEDLVVDCDRCSFKVMGFGATLRIAEKEEHSMIKVITDEGTPLNMNFWVQMKSTAPNETRLRLTLHVELNMMMKMMIGGKLEKGIDDIADKIAEAFNSI